MFSEDITLPPYPQKEDMWDRLASEKRPVVVYGMGNGADKLIEKFNEYGIEISDFFASDGFVRGHFFHGKRVKSFSEIREEYSDFVIVLSFASNRLEVIDMLSKINESYDMLVPDMPVCDTSEYFDKDFYNKNYEKIRMAYDALSDGFSRSLFASIVWFKLTGKMDYIMNFTSEKSEIYSLLLPEKCRKIIDLGAYNGDTLREAKEYFENLEQAYAVEPDSRNYKKLVKYSEAETDFKVNAINAAAWCERCVGGFSDSGNRNSTVCATASFEHKVTEVDFVSVDSLSLDGVDYIKYDVEGAEYEALIGSENTILNSRPALLVSLYHRSRDIFFLINFLHEKYPFYEMKLRRIRCLPAWEINLILTPNT
jgi:FkbM family methyltransferase